MRPIDALALMRRCTPLLGLSLTLLFATGPGAGPALASVREPDRVAIEELLRSARLWQALERPDAERRVLQKLLAVQADEPRALFLLGELELRSGDIGAARHALVLLRRGHGDSEAVRELQDLVRIYTQDKSRLAELRLAIRGGNRARALVLARALFPNGRPPGDLANEFAPVLASTPGGWENLRALLQERIAADPNPNDRLSLYELLAQHADTRAEALRGFADLARGHDVEPERVARAWRHALLALADDDEGLAERRRFLARFPADADVRAELARVETARLAAQHLEEDPAVQIRLQAVRSLDAGALEQAEAQLQRSLELRPDDGETVGTLGLLRLRQGRNDEALQQFEQASQLERLQPALRARWLDLATTARYWSALQRARALRDDGQLDAAVQLVESVRATQPDQNEAVHLLADLRVAQGRDAEAQRLYRELLAQDSGDRRAWRALLSLWLHEGRVEAALDEAQELPLKANVAVADVLDAGAVRDAIGRTAAQHPDAALRLLERSVGLLPRDPWLRYDLARLYLRLNLPVLAQQVMHEGQSAAPEDAQMRYAGALIEAASERDDAALASVQSIPAAEQTAGMRDLAQRLRFERDLRLARAARAAGNSEDDVRWRQQALAEAGDDTARRLRVARADISADDMEQARSLLDALGGDAKSMAPSERREFARALIDAGEPETALVLIEEMAAAQPADPQVLPELVLLRARAHRAQHDAAATRADWNALRALLPPQDVALHLEALQMMDADRPTAHEWMDDLLARHPQDPAVLLEAARQAQRDQQFALAVQYLQQVENAPPAAAQAVSSPVPLLAQQNGQAVAPNPAEQTGAPSEESVQRKAQLQLAAIEARRQPHIDTAWLGYSRSASDGTSTLRGTEVPVLAVWPGGYDGHWFAQLDSVRLDAGTLPAPLSSSAQFGKVLALAPGGLAQAVDEHAEGVSAAGGWRGEDRRFDLGVVGAGFKVPNVVGGWRESGTWHDTDLSAELSRRILNNSLLSYAGAADPVTGAVWGGVTDTGLSLRAGRDFAHGWSGSTSVSFGLLTGRDVQSNSTVQSRTVLDREWIHRADFRLSAGAVLSLWHYQSNESFYTFGQGGYYSPQRYFSIGVPVEAQGRHGLWSYDLRAVPSRDWTYEQNVAYYPTDAGLQALAGNPVHAAGAGGGWAGSLRADVEYRSGAHWSIGGWLDIDRSAYYAPNRLMFYVRYWFEPQQGAVSFPPHPVVPISLY